MPKLLKQTTSGFIYIWTPQLAQRSDMEPYELENTRDNVAQEEPPPAMDASLAKAVETFRKEVGRGRRPKVAKDAHESQQH